MRKFSNCLFLLFLLVGITGLAHAQNKSKALTSVIKAATEKTPSAFPRVRTPYISPVYSSTISQQIRSVGADATLSPQQQKMQFELEKLKQENLVLRELNIELKKSAVTNTIPTDAFIFQARETSDINTATNIFSGSIFSVIYNGQQEIYGVIATHSIAGRSTEKHALHKTFTAVIYKNGLQQLIPVEVVVASPQSMLDIALVKFPKEFEPLLVPYRLGKLTNEINLISKGFTGTLPTSIGNREILSCTPTSIRTTIPLGRNARPGLCGSAVLNNKNELVGIHTGSIYSQEGEHADIAYATPSYYLNNLVEAYHNNGKGTIPFILNDKKILDFAIEEYITYVSLFDTQKQLLWQLQVPSKFSYSKLQEALSKHPEAKFLQITTRQASWEENGYAFVENRSKQDQNPKTTYTYDLQQQELVSAMQSIYNPETRHKKTIRLFPLQEK